MGMHRTFRVTPTLAGNAGLDESVPKAAPCGAQTPPPPPSLRHNRSWRKKHAHRQGFDLERMSAHGILRRASSSRGETTLKLRDGTADFPPHDIDMPLCWARYRASDIQRKDQATCRWPRVPRALSGARNVYKTVSDCVPGEENGPCLGGLRSTRIKHVCLG